ncbi:hypothetical protein SUGI_1125820 [Cryptomeria japonica]|nr:hypothetical protein SUGI_1125820 [Cryptomeria japonica]
MRSELSGPAMENPETREREHEVQEFMALLERIESEKKYRREMIETHKRDSVKISQTWLSSFQWEDFNSNVHHPYQSHLEEEQTRKCMKRKRESSPPENIVDNKRSSSKENNVNNNHQRVIAAFDLNLEGESENPCSMGLPL